MSSIVEVLVNSSACEPCDLPVAGALTYLEWYDKYAENEQTFTALSELRVKAQKQYEIIIIINILSLINLLNKNNKKFNNVPTCHINSLSVEKCH